MKPALLLHQAKQLIREACSGAFAQKELLLRKAQVMVLYYLQDCPEDTQGWLLIALIECHAPLYDADRIIRCAKRILSYHPSNAYAALFWSYADYFLKGNNNDDFINILQKVDHADWQIRIMIEIAKARYFEHRNQQKYEESLKKSIVSYPQYRTNYQMLAEFYRSKGKIEEGNCYLVLSRKNVEKQRQEHVYKWDPTSIKSFLNEFFAGI